MLHLVAQNQSSLPSDSPCNLCKQESSFAQHVALTCRFVLVLSLFRNSLPKDGICNIFFQVFLIFTGCSIASRFLFVFKSKEKYPNFPSPPSLLFQFAVSLPGPQGKKKQRGGGDGGEGLETIF